MTGVLSVVKPVVGIRVSTTYVARVSTSVNGKIARTSPDSETNSSDVTFFTSPVEEPDIGSTAPFTVTTVT